MTRPASLMNTQHQAEDLALLGAVAAEQAVAVHMEKTVANFHNRAGQLPICVQAMELTSDLSRRNPAAIETAQHVASTRLARKDAWIVDDGARFQFAICGAGLLP